MNAVNDFGAMGRHYMQAEAYGAAAFCFYQELMRNRSNAKAWNGLVLALSLMRKDLDTQAALARYALEQTAEFERNLVSMAMMLWQQNPRALGQWVRQVALKKEVSNHDQEVFARLGDDLEATYAKLVSEQGEEKLQQQGMISLETLAERRTELDWIVSEPTEKLYEHVKQWMEDPTLVLTAIRMLCLMPDPRSEKLLRRACRNEELDPKARTHAALSLRWLGVRGNVRLHKLGESFIVNLDQPEPELTVSIPEAYKRPLHMMKVWLAMRLGLVAEQEYERYAASDEAQLPETVAKQVEKAPIATSYQEAVHSLIRAAYDHYYPLVPKVNGHRQWSLALLMLMKRFVEGIGEDWVFGELEQDDIAIGHMKWMLSASLDFEESIAEIAKLKTASQNV